MKFNNLLSTIILLITTMRQYAFIQRSCTIHTSHLQSQDSSKSIPVIDFEDALFLERFKRRLSSRSQCTPKQLVTSILSTLLTPHDPVKNGGYETLYSSSTEKWQFVLRKSVGAQNTTEEELIYQALANSMERENQQFGILVGMGVDDGSNADTTDANNKEYYSIEFPYDTLDYHDGTAWVECRLRNNQTDSLLVVLGWSLQEVSGEWKIDGMDWQDFREKYRPGIGREEWERICG